MSLGDHQLTLCDLVVQLQWKDSVSILKKMGEDLLIRQKSKLLGLTVSDQELELELIDFRSEKGLYQTTDYFQWLNNKHITQEQIETLLETQILRKKLPTYVITDAEVSQFIAFHRKQYDQVELSQCVVADEDTALEIFFQVTEEQADFHLLARTYSLDPTTSKRGGYLGVIARRVLTPEFAARVFTAPPECPLRPFLDGRSWKILFVHQIFPAEATPELQKTVRGELFDQWLAKAFENANFSIPLLNQSI